MSMKAQLARGEVVEQSFDPAKLPDGVAGVYRMISEHPLVAGVRRVDEVQDAMRFAYRAEVEALGWKIKVEEPFAVAAERPLRFPRSAIPAFPKAVNQLLAVERALERERATAAEKPGRAETNLEEDVLPKIKAIDAALVVEFHDALIDFFLEAGSEHYANRQAKAAVAAMKGKKGPSLEWLQRRCRQLIDKGFYSSLLADAALAAAEKTNGKAAAFDLALDIAERVLAKQIEPNEGILADLEKRAAATKGAAKLAALLLRQTTNGLLLSASTKKEIKAFRKAMLAAVDALPRAQRLETLTAMAEHARGEGGGLPQRAAMWPILTERVKELPELEDSIIRLACKICENIKIGDSHSDAGIDEGFRARVGQYLAKITPAAFERQFAFWATELDDYSDWARAWFYDTFLTMEELEESHPKLFKDPDIVRACTKGLLLGVKLAENKAEFLEKLLMFLELTEGRGARAADMVSVIAGLLDEDRGAEAKPLIEKLASEAKDTLQDTLTGLAAEAARRPTLALPIVRLLLENARFTTASARDQIRAAFRAAPVWHAFVEMALDTAVTLTAQEPWMDLGILRLTHRHDPLDLRIANGKRYFLAGKTDYDSTLWVLCDGELLYSWPPASGGDDDDDDADEKLGKLRAARFVEQGGELRVQLVLDKSGYREQVPWRLVTCDLDGGHPVEQELGVMTRAVFPRHATWIACLTEGQTIVRDATGATTLAEYDHASDDAPVITRSHVAIVGAASTLLLGDDPKAAVTVPRAAEGMFWDGTRMLAICKSGKVGGDVVTVGGVSVGSQQVMTGLEQCGQCEDWHSRQWRSTNLRGLPSDELVVRLEYKYWQLEDAAGGRHGRVDTDMGPEQDEYADILIGDHDRDGFDEIYVFDHRRKRVGRVHDRAARARAAIAGARSVVEGLAATPLGFTGTSAAALATHLEDAIRRAPEPVRAALADPGFAPVRGLLEDVRAVVAELDAAYGKEAESFPPRVRRERVKIAATELKRLHAANFEGAYGKIEAYPFAQAVLSGSIESYKKHWTREETGHEDMGFMRRMLAIHMDIARETGLAPVLRTRVIDLASQILDVCTAPTVWLGLTEPWGTEKELKGKIKEVFKTRSFEPVADQLKKLEEKWGVGPIEWTWKKTDDDDDRDALGIARIGNVTITVPIRFYDFGSTHWDPPWMIGPWQEVVALRPRFLKMVGAKAPPKDFWPKGKPAWEPLDDWFTPEEIVSTRGEIARLRTLPPDATTTGRAANGPEIAQLAARFGVKDDTAAVLGALVAVQAPDKDSIAAWAKVKRDAVHDHLKKLEKAGAVKKEGKELMLAVPLEGQRYEHDSDKIAVFKRLYWNRNWMPHMDSDLKKYRTKCARRFAEPDIIRDYLAHV